MLSGAARSHPTLYLILPKSPLGADSKARDLTLSDHPVNRGSVSVEYLADFFDVKDLVTANHAACESHDAPLRSQIETITLCKCKGHAVKIRLASIRLWLPVSPYRRQFSTPMSGNAPASAGAIAATMLRTL
jgi:hypothetical protein